MKNTKQFLTGLFFLMFSLKGFSQTSVTLDGSASFDADGSIANYSWRQISGPATTTITPASSASSKSVASGLTAGVYLFELTVTDNQGATGKDTVQITVLAANKPPHADAGADQTIQAPGTALINLPIKKEDENFAFITHK